MSDRAGLLWTVSPVRWWGAMLVCVSRALSRCGGRAFPVCPARMRLWLRCRAPRPRTPVRSCHLLPGESTARTAAAGAGAASPDLLHGRTMSIPTAQRNISCLLVQAAVKFEVRFKAQYGDLKNQQQSRMSSAWESK